MTINEWTTAMRYLPYEKWDPTHVQTLTKTVQNSSWRLAYHIQPTSGLLNDPNGFSYFNGQWHLFYQFYPFGPVHGLKSWYHLTSSNLIDWQEEGYGLLPTNEHDSHGVYSGTALPVGDQLFLAYTGNVRTEDWSRLSYQLGAWMDKEQKIQKIDTPLIPAPPIGYTQHFRDPQIIPYQNGYLLLIGAQNQAEEGKVLVYQGDSLTDWQFLGELAFTDHSLGFMVECPNLVFINDQPLLLFCPQGMEKDELTYGNIYPNTFVTGDAFDVDDLSLTNPSPIQNLDDGFDLYATQAFNAPDGRVLSVGWAGLPELEYPTDAEGWAHCLSLVRELDLQEGQLYQRPAREHQDLRQRQTPFQSTIQELQSLIEDNQQNAYELEWTISANSKGTLHLFADPENKHSLALHFDTKNGKIVLDRSRVSLPINPAFGTTRSVSLSAGQPLHLQIFVDQSICEIFVNDGRHVFTSRVFPNIEETQLFIEGTQGSYTGHHWELRSTSQN